MVSPPPPRPRPADQGPEPSVRHFIFCMRRHTLGLPGIWGETRGSSPWPPGRDPPGPLPILGAGPTGKLTKPTMI